MLHRALAAATLAACSSFAHATITFDEFTTNQIAFVNPVHTQGYVFTNNGGDVNALGVWGANSSTTMDPGHAAIFVNYGGTTTTMTSTAGAFDFYSIDLADVYNEGASVTIAFTFTHTGGASSTTNVTLDNQIGGQTFVFAQTDLTSVSWQTIGGANGWNQFDNVNVSAVPEPASLALMLAGLGAVGAAARRRSA